MSKSVLARIRNGKFTDADCRAYLVSSREHSGGFAKEVGDFIAHPSRDRGSTYNLALRLYSQLCFFQHFSKGKVSDRYVLLPVGPCPWWMKPWLHAQVDVFSPTDLVASLGVGPKKLKKRVNRWFPQNERYPEWIDCKDSNEFKETISKLGSLIGGSAAFETEDAYNSVRELLVRDKLDVPIDDFMACIAVVLSGTEVKLPFDVSGRVNLTAEPYTVWPAEPKSENPVRKMFMSSPFGVLSAGLVVGGPDLTIKVGCPIVDFQLDTKSYFSADISKSDKYGNVFFDPDAELSFENFNEPRVNKI